jgi:ATP-dependent protease HslVU (ClpYQ) ATPase subunit
MKQQKYGIVRSDPALFIGREAFKCSKKRDPGKSEASLID